MIKPPNKLLIVGQQQFGYHTNVYEYAKRLRDEFELTILCWDEGKPKISLDGVAIHYVIKAGNPFARMLYFRYQFLKVSAQGFNLIFIMYFTGASLVHFSAGRSTIICDVRSGGVTKSFFRRYFYDILLYLEISTFKHRTFVSPHLAKRFGIKKYHYLPLGGNKVHTDKKDFNQFEMIYVGVFNNRRIEDTVTGFAAFYKKYKNVINSKYTIIGIGTDEELALIEQSIAKYNLQEVIELTGYIPHNQLEPYLKKGNIGVSYIPITKYFDCQPPTKTYEYLLSGMPVLATATKEHKSLIHEGNGVLIQDNPRAVYDGLEQIYLNRFAYDSELIQRHSKKYTWEHIIESNLKNYLFNLSNR